MAARSARTDRPWHGIASYLIEAGYTVYLVNPLLDEALGRRCYDRLQDLPEPVGLVDVFRRVPELPGVVDDAIEAAAGALWLQLGIVHQQAAARAREAGLLVVMDACTKVEHARMGAGRSRSLGAPACGSRRCDTLTSRAPAQPGGVRLIPSLRESCGVMGVFAPGEDVARITFFGLHSLQHRGQESAGIATADGGARIHRFAEMGLVTQIFHEEVLTGLEGSHAIGHTRYSTTGSSTGANMQPLVVSGPHGDLALAHNGNVVNADLLRRDLLDRGVEFATGTDSEVLAQLIANAPGGTWEQRFAELMRRANGAYSLTVLTPDALFGVRDPLGIRPLCLGRIEDGWVIASETCALDTIGAELVREIAPGEVVRVDAAGVQSWTFGEGQGEGAADGNGVADKAGSALCLLEHIYFARPDSLIQGERLYPVRMRMGAQLAREHPAEGDVVIGIPDSANRRRRRLRAGVRHPLRGGPRQEPLRRPHLHPARPAVARPRRRAEVQPAAGAARRPPRHRRRRHHRARHHDPARRRDAAQGRRARGAHAHHLAADHASLLLRRRHGDARRADRLATRHRADPRAHRARTPSATSRSRAPSPPPASAAATSAPPASAASTPARCRCSSTSSPSRPTPRATATRSRSAPSIEGAVH